MFQCACSGLLLEIDKIFMKHDKTLIDLTMDHADRSEKWMTRIFSAVINSAQSCRWLPSVQRSVLHNYL